MKIFKLLNQHQKSLGLLVCLATTLSACQLKEKADLIVYNVNIHTPQESKGIFSHLAIKDGRIVGIGNDREINGRFEADQMVNGEGGFLYPGFIDSHCHFFGYATTLGSVDLTGSTSMDDMLKKVQIFAETEKKEGWITGRGWDHTRWNMTDFPDAHALDSLFPDRPVLLKRVDGHSALANKKALQLAGITSETQIEGGLIRRNGKEATGLLVDNAINLVEQAIPDMGRDELVERLLQAQSNCVAAGLTTLVDAGLDVWQMKIIDSLQKTGDLFLRLHIMLNPTPSNFAWAKETGGIENERLRVKAFKIYADGSLGSRGALLKEPYSDDPDNMGLLLTPISDIKKALKFCKDHGFQAATHCIGDSGNSLMLHLYGEVLNGSNDLRWRIEHAQVVADEDIPLFRKHVIIPSVQPYHAVSDMRWAEERLGTERVKNAYTYKKLMEQLSMIAIGSDFPVEGYDPLLALYSAVSRKDVLGMPQDGWQAAEKITREEALKGLGIWGAMSTFAEHFSGSIEIGKVADFVILDKDLLRCNEEDILETQVKQTFISGLKVN